MGHQFSLCPVCRGRLDHRHVRRLSDDGMNVCGEESSIQKVCGENYARPQNHLHFPVPADCEEQVRSIHPIAMRTVAAVCLCLRRRQDLFEEQARNHGVGARSRTGHNDMDMTR